MSEAVVTKPLIVGISGASGALYAIRLLLALQDIQEIETHLVISPAGEQIVKYEGLMKLDEVVALADFNYSPDDFFFPFSEWFISVRRYGDCSLFDETVVCNCQFIW